VRLPQPAPNVSAVALVITVAAPTRTGTLPMIPVATLVQIRAAALRRTPVVMPGWTRGVVRAWTHDRTRGVIRGWMRAVVPGWMRRLTPAGGAARIRARRVTVASTRGVTRDRTRGMVVAWTRGVVRGWRRLVIAVPVRDRTGGLSRTVILSAAGEWTLAVIPARPRGVSPGLACAVAPAGTVPVRIR
jgi:hypothetical protein